MVWASTSKKYSRFFNQLPCMLLRSLTAERVATLLAQLKEKQELRSIQSICPAMFKGSRRNCTVLAAPLDRQNCKICNALLLRLESRTQESHQRSHQSWNFTKSDLIAFRCFAFEFYIAIIVRSLLCREARRCGRRISMRSSLSQKHSMGQYGQHGVSSFSLFACLVFCYSSSWS